MLMAQSANVAFVRVVQIACISPGLPEIKLFHRNMHSKPVKFLQRGAGLPQFPINYD